MEEKGFCIYHGMDLDDQVLAAQITDENLDNLAHTVMGIAIDTPDDTPNGIFFESVSGSQDVSLVGDYIIADMGGNYLPVSKEVFEGHYTRT